MADLESPVLITPFLSVRKMRYDKKKISRHKTCIYSVLTFRSIIISCLWFQPVFLVSQETPVKSLVLLHRMENGVNIIVDHVRLVIMYTAALYIPVCAYFLFCFIYWFGSVLAIIQRNSSKCNSKNLRKCIIINVRKYTK